jgi:predicted GH43/DUF377 family glycosyl hydrolase
MRLQRLIIIAGMSMLSVAVIRAQEETLFTLADEEPAVVNSESVQEWDGVYTDPGAVFYHDGQFHMFRNGFNGWPASVQIGYLTSEDGITWEEVTEDPVLTTDEVPYAGVAALASSALVEDDGTWALYFYTWESRSGGNSRAAIGRATASDPLGPWTPDPEPILLPGSEGEWDEQHVSTPRVIRTEDDYVMYYSGYDSQGMSSSMIGMATSEDGITWTKYDDPDTTEVPFAESDPVLVSEEQNTFVHQPNVQITPDGWVMVYRTATGRGGGMRLYYARSDDGIHWEPATEEPVWIPGAIRNSRGFWFTALVYHDQTYYLYVESQRRNYTSIWVATYEGTLPE